MTSGHPATFACVNSRGHRFDPFFMKLSQTVHCWKLETGSCHVKTRSLSQILEKPYVHNRDSQFLSVVCSLFPKAIFFTFISFFIESL